MLLRQMNDEYWCILGLTAILRLLQRKNFTFTEPVVFIDA